MKSPLISEVAARSSELAAGSTIDSVAVRLFTSAGMSMVTVTSAAGRSMHTSSINPGTVPVSQLEP